MNAYFIADDVNSRFSADYLLVAYENYMVVFNCRLPKKKKKKKNVNDINICVPLLTKHYAHAHKFSKNVLRFNYCKQKPDMQSCFAKGCIITKKKKKRIYALLVT